MRTKITHSFQALVLIGAMLTFPPHCFGKERLNRSDWSNVQNIAPGRHVRITLLDRQIPRESRRLKGVFASADESCISAVLTDGSTRTLERLAVRRVAVRRPLLKRRSAWITTGVVAGLVQALVVRPMVGDDWRWGGATTLVGILVYLPVWGITILKTSHVVVYDTSSP